MDECYCMTEPDPLAPEGPERVLTHSFTCPLHPNYDGPGDAYYAARVQR